MINTERKSSLNPTEIPTIKKHTAELNYGFWATKLKEIKPPKQKKKKRAGETYWKKFKTFSSLIFLGKQTEIRNNKNHDFYDSVAGKKLVTDGQVR